MRDKFFTIINQQKIETLLQPIISLRDGSVYGFEALSRGPKDSPFHSPITLFEYADKYDSTWALESNCNHIIFEITEREAAKKISFTG